MENSAPQIYDGVYLNLPAEEYHRAHALSNSGMKALRVSPLTYWWQTAWNPAYEQTEETKAMRRGAMRHKFSLENESFFDSYFLAPHEDDYPDALKGSEAIKAFMKDNFIKPLTGKKAVLIQRIRDAGFDVEIWDEILAQAMEGKGDKIAVTKEDLAMLEFANKMLAPARHLITGGFAEVSVFWIDPVTGVRMKCRFDYWLPGLISDLKTFYNMGRFPLFKAASRDIDSKRGGTQSFNYLRGFEAAAEFIENGQIYGLSEDAQKRADQMELLNKIIEAGAPQFAFIYQTDVAPFETRILHWRQREFLQGTENSYWRAAANEVEAYCRTYQRYFEKYGAEPWVYLDSHEKILQDEDLPWSRYEDAEGVA